MTLNFAANISWLFQEWDFFDRFAAAADAGFTAVECLYPYDHDADAIAHHLARHHLTMALINLPPGDAARGDRGLAALSGRQADFSAALAAALVYARATGTGRLHVMAGIAQGPAAWVVYRDSLAQACDAAAPLGFTITIEPLNRRDMPGYLLNDFAMAERIIRDVSRSNLRLQFDTYHYQLLHDDVLGALERLMPLIGHIQMAAVPDRSEPGSGAGDDRAILRAIGRLGYTGFIGCEYRPLAGTLAGLGWMRPFI